MTLCTLALQFDFNQCTRSLQYSFSNTETKTGPLAGTFNFNASMDPKAPDTLEVILTVTGDAGGDPSVYVNDCTLVSVSNGKLGRTCLSPFSEDNAVSQITGWPKLRETTTGNRVEFSGKAAKKLTVVAQEGQWQISGYLSVTIELGGETYHRIFTFDPEGTAGSGNSFP